jgi:integrase
MSKVVEFKHHHSTTPTIENRKVLPTPPKYSQVREREYLTSSEIERISKAAKNVGRHGHRDMTMVMMSYRHALRVSELVNLKWSQVDLSQGLIHVNRLKNGVASVHPLGGHSIRALRKLKRDYPDTQYIFITERKGPLVADTVRYT